MHVELKKLLETQEGLVTDLKLLLYRRTDEIKKLTNIKKDTDCQLVETMQQIKNLAVERDLYRKEINDLKVAAQAIVDMVNPPEKDTDASGTLLEWLQRAPQGIIKYLSDTTRQYVSHILRLVKSYWPQANLTPLGDGMNIDCNEDKFAEHMEEVKPVADRNADSLEQEWWRAAWL